MPEAPGNRKLANLLDEIVERASTGRYGEAVKTKLAAAMGMPYSTLQAYLNGSHTIPAAWVGPFAATVADEFGADFGREVLRAVVGGDFDIVPREKSEMQTKSSTPRVLQEVGEALASLGTAEADNKITLKEAANFSREVEEAVEQLRAKAAEMQRRAR